MRSPLASCRTRAWNFCFWAEAVRRISGCLSVPLIADGDTGHGDVHNVARTVREFERAGASGILLEDQAHPKRCGHFAGKQVVSAEDMLTRLRAALDARRDPDFVIFARTDSLAIEGVDRAIERANRYGDAGADLCFVEAPRTKEELEQIGKEVNYPQLANMLLGGVTPILSADELESLGFKMVVDPVTSLAACGAAVRSLTRTFLETGRLDETPLELLSFDEIKQQLGLNDILKRHE
jgi:methylisocitrate lyase